MKRLLRDSWTSDDAAEGIAAFMAKRRPAFHGRS